MTTKLILIDTDTHVVVPREDAYRIGRALTDAQCGYVCETRMHWDELLEAPQLTTPPVLRWEGRRLFLGHCSIAYVLDGADEWYAGVLGEPIGKFATEQKAILAAEKALGLPIVEEA